MDSKANLRKVLVTLAAADKPVERFSMSEITASGPVCRLRFIDMARALAILFVLQGHFVELTLAPEWREKGGMLYEIWSYMRGMTAPMFFTVTGLIFAFLLSGARETGFFRIPRIRKGLKRVAVLMFWGYFLQVDLSHLPDPRHGVTDDWFAAFHVLQCIAIGLLAIMVIFGVVRRAGVWALAASYALSGLVIFMGSVWLAHQVGPIPTGSSVVLQNAIKGPGSIFPVFPWVCFTLYGAATGVLIRRSAAASNAGVMAAPFFLSGIFLRVIGREIDQFFGNAVLSFGEIPIAERVMPDFFHGRIAEILIILGFLVWIEHRYRPQATWLFTIGRNTFPIYVGHVIVLYGAIFGLGLNNSLEGMLNPWQAVIGAIVFCVFFGWLAQKIAPWTLSWRRFLDRQSVR